MEQMIISHRCPHCMKPLAKSDNPEYVWQCFGCDEDFYGIEAREVTVRITDPAPEDEMPFLSIGLNIDLSQRLKVTATLDSGETAYCFMERETVERLGAPYIADHAKVWHSDFLEQHVLDVSENDYYNDLTRFPEEVIPVEFVEFERGTGREVYRAEDGRYYLREVYYPRENAAKWFRCGTRRAFEDGDPLLRSNLIFRHHGQEERVRYDDWNGVMAYSDVFNKDFQTG